MTPTHPDKVGLWAKEWMEWEFIEFIQRYNVAPTDRDTIGRRTKTKAELVSTEWGVKGRDGTLRPNASDDNAFKFHQKLLQDRRCDLSLRWLQDGPMTKDEFESIAKPWPIDQMESYEVSRYVSRSGN